MQTRVGDRDKTLISNILPKPLYPLTGRQSLTAQNTTKWANI